MTTTTHPVVPTRRDRAARWWINGGLALLVVVASVIPDSIPSGDFRLDDDVDIPSGLVALVLAITLQWRHRQPRIVFWLVLGVATVMVGFGHPYLGYVLAVGVAVSQIARAGRRGAAIASAGVSIVALGLVLITGAQESFPRVVSVLAVVGFAGALGDAIHSRRALIDSILERAERAERTREEEAGRRVAEERLRIARELHDAAAHQIAVVNLQSGAATAALAHGRKEDAERALSAIRSATQDVLSEIAALLVVLRTEGLQNAPAAPPVAGLADLPELLERFRTAGLKVTLEDTDSLPELAGATDLVAYKVIQEGLTNAHKHGAAGCAGLTICIENEDLNIKIVNAIEPRASHHAISSGYGLQGIEERCTSVKGRVHVERQAESFTLAVLLPLPVGEQR
jgi:signal transduction histidine kinase